jgi:hypothetical protein
VAAAPRVARKRRRRASVIGDTAYRDVPGT